MKEQLVYIDKWKSNIHLIYNFLDKIDLEKAIEYLDQIQITNPKKTNTLGKANNRHLLNESQRKFFNDIEMKYETFMKKALQKVAPNKVHIATKLNCALAVLPANCSYPAHCDGLIKVLSGVIYIGEVKNLGTFVLDSKNDPNPQEIEWENNKMFLFSRKHNISWHNYKSNNNIRYSMILNLVTEEKFKHLRSEIGFLRAAYFYFCEYTKNFFIRFRNRLFNINK